MTNGAHLAVLLDVLSDAWPPVVMPHIVCCLLRPNMPQHFVCLGYHDFSDLSFVMDDGRYAKHRGVCAIAGVKEVTEDLEVFVVPDIVEDLGEKRVFLVPMLDALQYG